MRQHTICDIISNEAIADNIFDMELTFDKDLSDARAGQFAELYVHKGEHLLPRPISLCEIDKQAKRLRMVYQVVGEGTKYFSGLKPGDKLTVLAPLGNGFNILPNLKKVAVVGGGVGVPPMLQLVKDIRQKSPDAEITVFLGYRSQPYLIKGFAKTGANVHIATDDGSVGFKGNVIALMQSLEYESCDVVYSCGPKVMLKAVSQWAETRGIKCFVSMEERMACGLGVCVGCVVPVKSKHKDFEYKKVCKEGPVFNGSEVIWDD